MAVVRTTTYPGGGMDRIHDDCIITDPAQLRRAIDRVAEILNREYIRREIKKRQQEAKD